MLNWFRKCIWCDNDANKIVISRRCIAKLVRYAREYSPCECGSWLSGKYLSGKTCVILDIAKVPCDSTHGRGSFCRGVAGFESVGDNFVGEWHTHPGGTGLPSRTDDVTMERLRGCHLRGCTSPIMIILSGAMRGEGDVNIYIYHRDGRRVEFMRQRRIYG